MRALADRVMTRPRLYASGLIGIAATVVTGPDEGWTHASLIGWNVAIWLYMVVVVVVMLRADHGDIRRVAAREAENTPIELFVVVAAAIASVGAIAFELAGQQAVDWRHAALAGSTIAGSWLLLAILFALDYAARYYGADVDTVAGGLAFPSIEPDFKPDYTDFLYVSLTIAVACQTSDVQMTTRAMRRVALVQSVLAFAFNAAILALTINIGAGLVNPR